MGILSTVDLHALTKYQQLILILAKLKKYTSADFFAREAFLKGKALYN
jgi:hypothetical protein